MTTTNYEGLLKLIHDISFEVHRSEESPYEIITQRVALVPAEELGLLVLSAENFVSQFHVQSRFGFPRYTESWEDSLRGMLRRILLVGLSLDYA